MEGLDEKQVADSAIDFAPAGGGMEAEVGCGSAKTESWQAQRAPDGQSVDCKDSEAAADRAKARQCDVLLQY